MVKKRAVRKSGSGKKQSAIKEVKQADLKQEILQKERLDYFSKIKNMLFNLKEFVNAADKEKEIWPAAAAIFITFMIYTVLMAIFKIYLGILDIPLALIGALFGVLMVFGLILINYFLLHIFVLLLGGKQGLFNTYKSLTYAVTLIFIYLIFVLIAETIIPFDSSMLSTLNSATDSAQIKEAYSSFILQPGAILTFMIQIIMIVHFVIMLVYSISKFHKISKLRAFWAVAIYLVLIFVLLVLIQIAMISSSLAV